MIYALVTGGSRGIGRAICVKLASMGYNILINYKGNKIAAEETAALVQAQRMQAETLACDVANPAEVQQTLGSWLETHKDDKIEVLVNNAGIRQDTLLMSMTTDQWSSVLDTSLGGM